MFSIREVLDLAVQIEKNGERFYREAMRRFLDPSVLSLLQWMAEEEVKHAEWFSKRKELLPQGEGERKEIESGLLVGILGDQTFSLKEADFSTIHDVGKMLEVALEFEKDTILFYEFIQSLVEDRETSKELQEILEEERRHIQNLEQYRNSVR
ncbi:MAG: ferritin family protein [Deltaproteobacteria bacterium]|nr:ferritin family protein [Deltaproteobacteria bacterium]